MKMFSSQGASRSTKRPLKCRPDRKCAWCASLLTYFAVLAVYNEHKSAIMKGAQHSQNGVAEQTHFKLLVMYAYFESESIPFCEKIMKRTNLATFINAGVSDSPDVTYLFSISGETPKASEFYSSIDLESPYGDSIVPKFANVFVRTPRKSNVPDLCQHALGFMMSRRRMEYLHVAFLNDGVRGPFDVTKPSTVTYSQGAPDWIQSHLALLHSAPNIGAVGSVMSCELTLHLQGWFVLLHANLFAKHLHIFKSTCHMKSWQAAISKETEFSTAILRDGFDLATFFPETLVIGRRNFSTEMRSRLNDCVNPISAFRLRNKQNAIAPLDLDKVRFLKIGGSFYRHDILTHATKIEIHNFTSSKLGVDRTDYYCFRNSKLASDFRSNFDLGQGW